MADLRDTYVVHGGIITCTKASRESMVVLSNTHGVFLKGQPQMTVEDCKVNENIINFGGCFSMKNPSTQAAAEKIKQDVKEASPDTFTDKVMGFFTKKKDKEGEITEGTVMGECHPYIVATSWDHGQARVKTDGVRPVMGGARLECMYGGMIEIVDPGQIKEGS